MIPYIGFGGGEHSGGHRWFPHVAVMFVSMIVTQTVLMPLAMIVTPAHYQPSLGQLYIGVAMAAGSIVAEGVILKNIPWWVLLITAILGIGSVVAYRWQLGIDDRAFLRDMIPHHSMALLTSIPKLDSKDPFISRLADQIVITQTREIADMKGHLESSLK